MNQESGRSLLEIIGVLAIGAVLLSTSITAYNSINAKQKRMIATENIKDIATKTKTLLEYSGYQPVSVNFLIEAGAIKNTNAPLGGADWSVTSNFDGTEFSVNLVDISYSDCVYFATKKLDWLDHIAINDVYSTESFFCMKTGDNKISFVVK